MMTDSTVPTPVEQAIAADDRQSAKGRLGWLSLVIAALFGLLYAYDVWEAIGNLIGIPEIYDRLGFAASTPWPLLIAGLFIPVVVCVIAFLIGLRRNLGEKALLLLTGLAVSNGLTLGTIGLNSMIFSELLHSL